MKRIFVINHDSFGHGSEERGREGMGVFFLKLWAKEDKPDAIVLVNSAVKMAVKGSKHLAGLTGLVDAGVDLVVSSESLRALAIEELLFVGRELDMDEISELIMSADQVLSL